jgi:hypothetical protein
MNVSLINNSLLFEDYWGLAEPLRDKIRDYGRGKDVNIIYHYTKSSGLLGILKEQVIHATYYRFLNDKSELRVAPELANEILLSKLKQEIPKPLHITLKNSVDKVKDLSVYNVSFSEEGNLLSQWRAYASPQGYSLGFKSSLGNYIETCLEPYTVFSRCIYSREDQERLIKEAIKFLWEKWNEKNREKNLLSMIESAFRDFIYLASCFFKDLGFRKEREWRIAVLVDNTKVIKPKIHFRQTGSGIVPYINVPLTPIEFPTHNEIENTEPVKVIELEEIIVGPPNNAGIQHEVVELLVKELGVNVKRISSSTIPLKS